MSCPTSEHESEQKQHSSNTTNATPSHPKKARATHFLCLPLVTKSSIPQLAASLSHFRDVTTQIPQLETPTSTSTPTRTSDSRSSDKLRLIPPQAHRPPGTFHLTLGVMDLSQPSQMQRATKLLNSLDLEGLLLSSSSSPPSPPSTPPTPLNVSLQGLSSFPSPNSARVFYAKPSDPTNRLSTFAIRIRQIFREAGLINEGGGLVLHATVANLRYGVSTSAAPDKGGNGNGNGTGRGKGSKYGKRGREREQAGSVDGREIITFFDTEGGVVKDVEGEEGEEARDEKEVEGKEKEEKKVGGEYVWAEDIPVDRLAICRLGAVESADEVWGLEYPPVVLKMF